MFSTSSLIVFRIQLLLFSTAMSSGWIDLSVILYLTLKIVFIFSVYRSIKKCNTAEFPIFHNLVLWPRNKQKAAHYLSTLMIFFWGISILPNCFEDNFFDCFWRRAAKELNVVCLYVSNLVCAFSWYESLYVHLLFWTWYNWSIWQHLNSNIWVNLSIQI